MERSYSGVTVTAHSPEVIGEVINAKEYFTEGDPRQAMASVDVGVPSVRLREWVNIWDEKSFALRFRSLNALYVPQG